MGRWIFLYDGQWHTKTATVSIILEAQSLYEGMRQRYVRNSLDFGYLEYPKICLPLVESIQRIMIGA